MTLLDEVTAQGMRSDASGAGGCNDEGTRLGASGAEGTRSDASGPWDGGRSSQGNIDPDPASSEEGR